jgi:hypothetical protein
MNKIFAHYIVLNLITLTCLFLSPVYVQSTEQDKSKKILLLYSFHQYMKSNLLIEQGIRETLKQRMQKPVELFSEYMERLKRYDLPIQNWRTALQKWQMISNMERLLR